MIGWIRRLTGRRRSDAGNIKSMFEPSTKSRTRAERIYDDTCKMMNVDPKDTNPEAGYRKMSPDLAEELRRKGERFEP